MRELDDFGDKIVDGLVAFLTPSWAATLVLFFELGKVSMWSIAFSLSEISIAPLPT